MKKTAFLQAFILLILLGGSWMIFLNRARQPNSGSGNEVNAIRSETPDSDSSPEVPTVEVTAEPEIPTGPGHTLSAAPPQWQAWMDYLLQQPTPADLEIALREMREALFSMSREDASARLIELIISRADLDTGSAFQVGEGGTLLGAPTLQVLLLDWLGQIDSPRAAGLAQLALKGGGERLGPDLFVMHLRNYTWGTPSEDPAKEAFLHEQFGLILGQKSWIEQPPHSVAESMDLAVHLNDPSLTGRLARLMGPGQSSAIRYAASMALERMVDQNPLPVARQLLEAPEATDLSPEARASLMARLDPSVAEIDALLQTYLFEQNISREEAALFLRHFPNLNRTLSHNLFSNSIPNTSGYDPAERLQGALEFVESRNDEARAAGFGDALDEAAERLRSQVQMKPDPK